MSTHGEASTIPNFSTPKTEAEYREQAEFIVRNFPEKLAKLSKRLRFASDLLALFRYMTDPEVHWGKKALVVGALAYFIIPADAIPDIAPAIGFLDDIGVIALVIRYLGKEIKPYYAWDEEPGRTAARPADPLDAQEELFG